MYSYILLFRKLKYKGGESRMITIHWVNSIQADLLARIMAVLEGM